MLNEVFKKQQILVPITVHKIKGDHVVCKGRWKKPKRASKDWNLVTCNICLRAKKETCPPHEWDKDGERCRKCGIKDWMV